MNDTLRGTMVKLRFVRRDGERILQELWVGSQLTDTGYWEPLREWRDVPMVTDE